MNNIMESPQNNQLGMIEESRALSEIKGRIFLAKQFPRNEDVALQKILKECQNPKIAETAAYSYTRGTSEVRGASIRLAEVIARNWGNFDSGVVELEQRRGESTIKAFAWDLESNYRDEKIFTVKHERSTKKGSCSVTDSRDIYELVANNAARRKRATILAVIPSYIVDMALDKCAETLQKNVTNGKTIEEVREEYFECFHTLVPDVTKDMLCQITNKAFDNWGRDDIVKIRNLYNAIKDGFVKPDTVFGKEKAVLPSTEEDDALDKVNKALAGDEND